MKGKTEILLINSSAALAPHPSFRSPAKENHAPLGLFCLAQIAPERIAVIDLQYSLPAEEFFAGFSPDSIHTIVIRAGRDHDQKHIEALIGGCRAFFPAARIGLAGTINKSFVGCGDFYIYGTGYKSLLTALRGERLHGFINLLADELEMPLPIPPDPFPEIYNFAASPEKTIARKTLEVFQPWLGLFERSEKTLTYPGLKWLATLVHWLKDSGYSELHFRPSGVCPADIHELRSMMLNLQVDFALSFKNISAAELENNCAGAPLRQIWLYRPEPQNLANADKCLQIIAAQGCCPGLYLGKESASAPALSSLLANARRLALAELETWQLDELKKVLFKFWGTKNRFFRLLFSIRSAYDLISFMKTSAFILEILFSKNQKNR